MGQGIRAPPNCRLVNLHQYQASLTVAAGELKNKYVGDSNAIEKNGGLLDGGFAGVLRRHR
jgi:hypothetical protein